MAVQKSTKGITIDEIAAFAKRKGFVFPSSEIYGSLAGFWDYGPLGVEMKRNIVNELWKNFVTGRKDIVGIDGSIITHLNVWKASGHVKSFTDSLVECKKCKSRFRADSLIEETLGISVDGLSLERMNEIIIKDKIKCPKCGNGLEAAKTFNLMFKTHVGPEGETEAYLRPETAQSIFINYEQVQRTARLKLPFGIAQVGKAFRNEISPRNFLFRSREFEMFEIEFFLHPDKLDECSLRDMEDYELLIFSREEQKNKKEAVKISVANAIKKKIFKTKWHAYWLAQFHKFFCSLGIDSEKLRLRQHLEEELSHYASDTWDIEYCFPFGWKEIHGCANRTDFDLRQHMKESGKDLQYFDEQTQQKIIPHVIEPSQGIDRLFLAFLIDAYQKEKERTVLKIHPILAPIKIGVFPLVNREGMPEKAEKIFEELRKEFSCFYDDSGSIGRRYARQDEAGTPFCITIDGETIKKGIVTIRDRGSMKQISVKTENLADTIRKLMAGEKFEKAGKLIKYI